MKKLILEYSSILLLGSFLGGGGGELDSGPRPKSQKIILEEMGQAHQC